LKTPAPQPKIPSPDEIYRKVKLSYDLLHAAYVIKKHQLEKKHPEKSDQELSHMTMALIEKGLR